MSTNKHFDKICCIVLVLALVITVLFMNGESLGIKKASAVCVYEEKLFDDSIVHTVDIIMNNWDEFIESCTSEEYSPCTVVIDNESYKNVAIRAKGNTSLTQVKSYGNNRYSFKIEFDHYDSSKTYHGLDKLCLNNIIQDNTYLKDYITFKMMAEAGVPSPLVSFVYITVNGEDFGLYLAVEAIEKSFLQRNYGSDYGELYKPDSNELGGNSKENGGNIDGERQFNDDDFKKESLRDTGETPELKTDEESGSRLQKHDKKEFTDKDGSPLESGEMPEMPNSGLDGSPFENDEMPDMPEEGFKENNRQEGMHDNKNGMRGSDDVLLKYIDDNFSSYPNIFDNAKTDIKDSDKERLISALKVLSNTDAAANAVNISEVISYFTVHNFVLNFDSYTGSMIHNYYLYEKDGTLQMLPWDYNLAFGGFSSAGGATSLVNYPIDSPVSEGSLTERPMIAWIFANDEYLEKYHTAFSQFIAEYFESGIFEEQIDSVISLISPYVQKDPTAFCTYEEFLTGSNTLKEFCLLRAESVRAQLNGTIGTTTEAQDSASFINADSLNIADMGSNARQITH